MTHRLLYISCCDVVDGALFGQKWWTLGLGLVRLVLALGLVVAETYRPLHVFFLLQNCLPSHRPLWTDIYPTNIISQWQDEWKSALVVNSSLVDDPTIWQSGFDLCRCHWALLSRFQTNQGHCASCAVVCASGRVGRSLSFGRFFVVFAVFDIVYIHYYRTNCFTTLSR